jgi:HAE1 family hydrophobic/amphiphilic exporter-1
MMILALVVLGYSSFTDMNVDLMPEVDFPFVIVQTFYPGAGAEAVETDVTKTIEDATNPISGVKHISSSSQEGYSLVVVQFMLEKNSMEAAQEVREKVSAIRDQLPEDIEEPVISRYDPDSEPIISLTISGERPLREITDYVKDDIQKTLEAIPGVGAVTLVGGFEREINLYLDIDKLESYEIPIDKVQSAVRAANLEIPGGRVNEQNREYLVRTMGKLTSVSQFDNIPIDNPHGQPVYLRDIATVVDGVEERRSLARVDGKEAITLSISRQSGGNTVEVARSVKEEVSRMKDRLPPDMNINIVVDNSTFIEDAIHEVLMNIYYGGFLAVLVIFLFLADIRSTIISAIAIPSSIIATFTFMNALGFTLNMMSLLALAIAVGLLIDDAIVVIENIFRHLQKGESPWKAAFNGTKEIGLAVMATTFTIVVVFMPVAFMKGIVGRFFFQFGMTVAFAVVVSLFVAFSLTPMLSSRWLKPEGYENQTSKSRLMRLINRLYAIIQKIIRPWNLFFDKVNQYYKIILKWSLNHRFLVMAFATASFIFALFLGYLAGVEFVPETDESRFLIIAETPPGTDLQTTSARFTEVENLIRKEFEGVDMIFTTIGSGQTPVNEGSIFVKLVDKDNRPLSAQKMIDSARIVVSSIPGIKFAVAKQHGEGGGEKSAELSVRGNDLEILTDLTHKIEDIYRRIPGVVDLDNSLQEGKPELRVRIDRDLANDLGVDVMGIGSSVRALVEGEVVTRYKEGDREYDVRIRLKEEDRSNTAQVGRVLVESNKEVTGRRNFLVPLANVAKFEKTTAIGEYNRYDRLREVRVGSNVSSDAFAGTVIGQVVNGINEEIDIPPGYYVGKTGTAEIQEESFGYIFEALFLAIIFIYLLLASQFESFFDPFSIMFSLPLSLVGAIVALLIMGNSISIISLIGIIMLMGLVTKNAILLIDFIKQNRQRGVKRTEAVLMAGPIRLRPILMTTLSLIFGVMPIALGIGPGAEFRAPMARAVIGGMTSSTLLTLIVVPVVYTIIDDIVAFFLKRETVTVKTESLDNV